MDYLIEVYSRIHWILVSVVSWHIWLVIIVILGGIVVVARDGNAKYKNQITYYFIVFTVGTFILRILFWIFLPSPELIGGVND